MADNIVLASEVKSLLDSWIEAERNGVKFPVPFETAWRMADYSGKDAAKRELRSLKKGVQFSCDLWKTPGGGRSSELIDLSVDGFKHFCLMADTESGKATRQYLIDAEKKWRLVQEQHPQVAEEVEILKLKRDIATQEAIAAKATQEALSIRHYVVNALPKATADRILGVTTIEQGETLSKTALAQRYGFVTKSGKPDTKLVTKLVEEAIASRAIPNPWRDVRVVASAGFDANLLDTLDRFFDANPQERQRWIGE